MAERKEKQPTLYEFIDEEGQKAAEKAMSLLMFKDRTKQELIERLYRAGFSKKASQEAMEYVEHFGYIDDRRYTENYIMFQKGKRSRKEIVFKLVEKGISKELIQQILEKDEYEGEDEAIQSLIVKKLKGKSVTEITYEEKNKIIAYLGRKGFELRTIKNVFSKLDNFY